MKQFIVYNNEGEVLRTGSCGDGDFKSQSNGPNEFVMEGVADDRIHKVEVIEGKPTIFGKDEQ